MVNKTLVWILVIILTGIGLTLKFSTSHESMPIGCDEFGYLNLAREMESVQGIRVPYQEKVISPLIDTLRQNGVSNNEIIWMVTPHAYHMNLDDKYRINQYPPATSFLLQLIPVEYRKILFPLLVVVTLVLPLILFSFNMNKIEFTLAEILLVIFIFILTVTSPFMTELTRVNSVAPTFGLLLAAGFLLNKSPLLAISLIAITANFRVANVILLAPVFILFIYNFNKRFDFKNTAKFVLIVTISLVPILWYQYKIYGSPFTSTYSVIDKSFVSLSGLLDSGKFYFSFSQQWFLVHLIVLGILLLLLLLKKFQWSFFFKIVSIPLFNYIFFMVHEVKMDYYPYASAIILMGVLLYYSNHIFIGKAMAYVVIAGLTLTILISGIRRYNKREHISFSEAQSRYSFLCDYDVVWGDLLTGTTEYVCGNLGFRYGASSSYARIMAMKFLKGRQISQIILLSDNTESTEVILNDLNRGQINYRIENNQFIGDFLIIE